MNDFIDDILGLVGSILATTFIVLGIILLFAAAVPHGRHPTSDARHHVRYAETTR